MKSRLFILGLLLPACQWLQAAEVNDSSRVVDLDEVIVVAQPKEGFLLRQQPMSSSALGSADLQQLHIQSMGQLSGYVPSFAMPEYGSRLTSSIYIRGIGARVNNSAVGIYYDHIPLMSKSAFNSHFYMLDRVDVLRGPQGTLYGANTEGGIVRMYSKNPMHYQGTDIRVGVGTAFHRKAEVAHYHRPSDRLAFMVAGFYNGQDGFFRNVNLDERNDRMDEAGAKLRLVYQPNHRLTFDVTSDYQYTIQNGFPYGLYHVDDDATDDPSTTYMNSYRRQMVNTGLHIAYDMGSLLLTSTTSHQYLWDRMNMDQDYVATDYMRLMQQQKMNAVTQELVLRSKTAGRWQHTTGVFGSYEWLHTLGPVYFGDAMGAFIMTQWGMPAAQHSFMKFQDYHVPGDFHTPQLNVGIYHESNILLTDRFKVTLGLRYDYSRVKIDYDTQARFRLDVNMGQMRANHAFLSAFNDSQTNTYNQVLPKVGLTYTFDGEGSNVYAVVGKGFRAGGYNLQMFSDIFQTEAKGLGHALRSMMTADYVAEHTPEQVEAVNNTISYKPEESWNFEAGTHLNLFGSRLRADVSLFYTMIRNQQLSVMAGNYGFGRAMVNAGKSYSCGAELALRGSAVDNHLTWAATYSFTHACFKEYDDLDEEGHAVSYKDNHVPFIPSHKFSINSDYRVDLGHDGFRAITFGANVTGQGKTYWEADNVLSQKFYALLGAHVALDMGAVELDVWGRNLTNTNYNTFLVYSKMTGQNFAQRGNPVQVGFDLNIHF
ncbi:MAG: TonB-dependent receptor [Prevotella sp.]|nr:TonB-dependent receptor [Prevotella sp.]